MFGALAGSYVVSSPSSRPEISLRVRGLREDAVAGVELVRDRVSLLAFIAGLRELIRRTHGAMLRLEATQTRLPLHFTGIQAGSPGPVLMFCNEIGHITALKHEAAHAP